MAEAVSADYMSTEEFVKSLEVDLRVPGRWLADHPLVGRLERGELTRGVRIRARTGARTPCPRC